MVSFLSLLFTVLSLILTPTSLKVTASTVSYESGKDTVAACVICYGRLVTDSSNIARIHCPTLGLFGEEDQGITPQSVHEFEAACKGLGKQIDVKIYQNAGHAFMNPNNKGGYRKLSAADAWEKIYNFFSNTLAHKP